MITFALLLLTTGSATAVVEEGQKGGIAEKVAGLFDASGEVLHSMTNVAIDQQAHLFHSQTNNLKDGISGAVDYGKNLGDVVNQGISDFNNFLIDGAAIPFKVTDKVFQELETDASADGGIIDGLSNVAQIGTKAVMAVPVETANMVVDWGSEAATDLLINGQAAVDHTNKFGHGMAGAFVDATDDLFENGELVVEGVLGLEPDTDTRHTPQGVWKELHTILDNSQDVVTGVTATAFGMGHNIKSGTVNVMDDAIDLGKSFGTGFNDVVNKAGVGAFGKVAAATIDAGQKSMGKIHNAYFGA